HDGTHDGLPHPHVPSCFACVVMASPGLASSGFLVAGRIALPVPAALDPPAAAPRRHVAWTPQSARAPPTGSIV
ncbi:hypothetical protein, partial [uncultured Amaricoccus sp.]|uniref:hypothetical protein n=1 Tax=uncultured Amaricoccus sp. TaxID=339341 RepID=UPI00262130B1